jgi:hypothetical protein
MQTITNIVLTCKDIAPTIFINYTILLNKQENMLKEIELAKKDLLLLGVDPDDETNTDKGSFWPYMDSELEKQQQKIKIAQLKLSKCEFEYELLKNESSQKFYEFQKVNSQIMEMLVYVIQEIAYKEEQKKLKNIKNIKNINNNTPDEMLYISEEETEETEETEKDCLNPDFPRNSKNKKLLFILTRIEPFLIIVLSVLLLIHYKPVFQ